jgi:phospholipase C
VPAIAVSPWIPEATIDNRVFDHASIPATVTKHFIGDFAERSPRELAAQTFVDVLTLPAPRHDAIGFQVMGSFDFSSPIPPGTVFYELPPPDAVHVERPMTVLQQEQVNELYQAESLLPPELRTGIDVSGLRTEQDAAAYTQAVMRRLHSAVAP